ncbi:hypothetical protein [Sporosarcina sp. NPDC096371]
MINVQKFDKQMNALVGKNKLELPTRYLGGKRLTGMVLATP